MQIARVMSFGVVATAETLIQEVDNETEGLAKAVQAFTECSDTFKGLMEQYETDGDAEKAEHYKEEMWLMDDYVAILKGEDLTHEGETVEGDEHHAHTPSKVDKQDIKTYCKENDTPVTWNEMHYLNPKIIKKLEEQLGGEDGLKALHDKLETCEAAEAALEGSDKEHTEEHHALAVKIHDFINLVDHEEFDSKYGGHALANANDDERKELAEVCGAGTESDITEIEFSYLYSAMQFELDDAIMEKLETCKNGITDDSEHHEQIVTIEDIEHLMQGTPVAVEDKHTMHAIKSNPEEYQALKDACPDVQENEWEYANNLLVLALYNAIDQDELKSHLSDCFDTVKAAYDALPKGDAEAAKMMELKATINDYLAATGEEKKTVSAADTIEPKTEDDAAPVTEDDAAYETKESRFLAAKADAKADATTADATGHECHALGTAGGKDEHKYAEEKCPMVTAEEWAFMDSKVAMMCSGTEASEAPEAETTL